MENQTNNSKTKETKREDGGDWISRTDLVALLNREKINSFGHQRTGDYRIGLNKAVEITLNLESSINIPYPWKAAINPMFKYVDELISFATRLGEHKASTTDRFIIQSAEAAVRLAKKDLLSIIEESKKPLTVLIQEHLNKFNSFLIAEYGVSLADIPNKDLPIFNEEFKSTQPNLL